jgi:hypothetical protein
LDNAQKLDERISRRKLIRAGGITGLSTVAALALAGVRAPTVRGLVNHGNPDFLELTPYSGIPTRKSGSDMLVFSNANDNNEPYLEDTSGNLWPMRTRQQATYIVEAILTTPPSTYTFYARPAPNSGLTAYAGGSAAAAIQTAITGALGAGGGKVIIRNPPVGLSGVYSLSTDLSIPTSGSGELNLAIEGETIEGVVLQQTASSKNVFTIGAGAKRLTLRNLRLKQTQSSTGDCINITQSSSINNCYGLDFENMYLDGHDANHYGMTINNLFYSHMKNVKIGLHSTSGGGIHFITNNASNLYLGNSCFDDINIQLGYSNTYGIFFDNAVGSGHQCINLLTFNFLGILQSASGGLTGNIGLYWPDLSGADNNRMMTFINSDFENVNTLISDSGGPSASTSNGNTFTGGFMNNGNIFVKYAIPSFHGVRFAGTMTLNVNSLAAGYYGCAFGGGVTKTNDSSAHYY